MAAKNGGVGFPSKWTPLSAWVFGLIVGATLISCVAIITSLAERAKITKRFEVYQIELGTYKTQIEAYQEQLDNYRKVLAKKDTSVVPILLKLRPQLDVAVAAEISKAVMKHATQFRLPPEFIVHLMKRESGFNTLAVSKVGAVGLMQVLPKAHKPEMTKLGISHSQLFHIDNNVKLGCMILREYYDKTGSIEKALTCIS